LLRPQSLRRIRRRLGFHKIVPVSAPKLTLEAPDAATSGGALVSINKVTNSANQHWNVVARGNGLFAIKPLKDLALSLAVAR